MSKKLVIALGGNALGNNAEVVSYTHLSEKQDFFRVSLYDKALNQEQTIIRNQEGVFVVTPVSYTHLDVYKRQI